MKNNKYILNTILTVVLFTAMLAMMLVKTFQPAAVLPELNIPNMVLISLVALLIEYYAAPGAVRCYICIPVLSCLTFGLLPLMAGCVALGEVWKVALAGGVTFTVTTWLFTSMTERMASGPRAKAAAVLSALGLFLAAQCFAGIIL